MNNPYQNLRPMIGQAWTGRHVLLLQCQLDTNTVKHLNKSLHAPTEPIHTNCAETLSQHLSIGYTVMHTTFIPANQIQYLLVL